MAAALTVEALILVIQFNFLTEWFLNLFLLTFLVLGIQSVKTEKLMISDLLLLFWGEGCIGGGCELYVCFGS